MDSFSVRVFARRVIFTSLAAVIPMLSPLPAGAAAAPAELANDPGATIAPFTADQTLALCEVNAQPEFDLVDSKLAVTASWTLFDTKEDAHVVLARVKAQLASDTNVTVTGERYDGNHGWLDMSAGPERSPGHLEVDSDMGLVGVSLESSMKLAVLQRAAMTFQVCKLAAYATSTPLPTDPSAPKPAVRGPIFRNPFKREKPDAAATANLATYIHGKASLYQRARSSGKGFVIVPVTNMTDKYALGASLGKVKTDQLQDYWAEGSGRTIWRAKGDDKRELVIGAWASQSRVGLRGFVQDVDVGKSVYQLYIVEPGTYDLRGAAMERRNISLPKGSGKAFGKTLGDFRARFTQDDVFQNGEQWKDPTFITEGYDQSYCVTQLVDGHCIDSVTQRQYATRQATAGGYEKTIVATAAPGFAASVELATPFASFTVGRGEVALLDGFVLDRSSMDIDPASCKASATSGSCALKEFSPWRVSAAVPAYTARVANMPATSPVRPIFEAAKPASLVVNARAMPPPTDGYEAGWASKVERTAH